MRIVLFILFVISWTGVFAQTKTEYCLVDTVEVQGYLVFRYHKNDIEMYRKYKKQEKEFKQGLWDTLEQPIDWRTGSRIWVTTRINNKQKLDSGTIHAILLEDFYESIENVVFPPVSSDMVYHIPELANSRDTVLSLACSYFKRTGDNEYLYKFTEVKGKAERYFVKTREGAEYDGWWIPQPSVRVPYVYLYFFRWKDKVSLTTDTPLDGYKLYWDGKY